MFVFQDNDDIGENEVVMYDLQCPIAHPLVCATRDAHCYDDLMTAMTSVRKVMASCHRGSWHKFTVNRVAGDGGIVIHSDDIYVALAHFRGESHSASSPTP